MSWVLLALLQSRKAGSLTVVSFADQTLFPQGRLNSGPDEKLYMRLRLHLMVTDVKILNLYGSELEISSIFCGEFVMFKIIHNLIISCT